VRRFGPVVLPALGALLSGCGGSGPSTAGVPATTEATAAPSATASPSASADPRDALSGSTLAEGSSYRDAAGETSFRSPTQNIGCTVGAATVSCQIATFSYRTTPSQCHGNGNWGSTIDLSAAAEFVCATDAVASGAKQLAYGQRLAKGHLACVSRPDGVTCLNRDSGHGFRVAQREYVFF
jgi:hypothetical protein